MTTAFVPANGTTVNLRECPVCGSLWAGGPGHSPGGEASDTEFHKTALAVKERKAK